MFLVGIGIGLASASKFPARKVQKQGLPSEVTNEIDQKAHTQKTPTNPKRLLKPKSAGQTISVDYTLLLTLANVTLNN